MKHLAKPFITSAIAGLVSVACAQYSSPELMLVADGGNGTAAHPAQVERYDPTTGMYLGAFGAGFLENPLAITVVGQDAYVSDQYTYQGVIHSKIDRFNFSTGAFDGSIDYTQPTQLFGLASYGSGLLACDIDNAAAGNGAVFSFNAAGQLTGTQVLPPTYYAWGIATAGSQDFISLASNQGLLSETLDAQGNATGTAFQAGVGTYSYHSVATTSYLSGTVFAAGTDMNNLNVIDEYSTSGTLLNQFRNTSPFVTYRSLAFGHNGILYVFDQQGASIDRFDAGAGIEYGQLGSFALSHTTGAVGIAIYAAPEPASVFALGLGAIALRRRLARGRR